MEISVFSVVCQVAATLNLLNNSLVNSTTVSSFFVMSGLLAPVTQCWNKNPWYSIRRHRDTIWTIFKIFKSFHYCRVASNFYFKISSARVWYLQLSLTVVNSFSYILWRIQSNFKTSCFWNLSLVVNIIILVTT